VVGHIHLKKFNRFETLVYGFGTPFLRCTVSDFVLNLLHLIHIKQGR